MSTFGNAPALTDQEVQDVTPDGDTMLDAAFDEGLTGIAAVVEPPDAATVRRILGQLMDYGKVYRDPRTQELVPEYPWAGIAADVIARHIAVVVVQERRLA